MSRPYDVVTMMERFVLEAEQPREMDDKRKWWQWKSPSVVKPPGAVGSPWVSRFWVSGVFRMVLEELSPAELENLKRRTANAFVNFD